MIVKNFYNDSVFKEIKKILNKKVKVFCIILTESKYHEEKIIHQKSTWIKRCDNYIFGSGVKNDSLPSIKACYNDSYNYSMCKFRNTLKYVWNNYGEEYNWYIKVDDSTYVIMENLKVFLLNKNPNDLKYFGSSFEINDKENLHYFYGGIGYVLSKKTVQLLVEKGFDSFDYCSHVDEGNDDIEVGKCLKKLGVGFSESFDVKKKTLFNTFTPQQTLLQNTNIKKKNSTILSGNTIEQVIERISDFPILFHNVDNTTMYTLEYFFYHAQVVGRGSIFDRMNDQNNNINHSMVAEKFKLINQFSEFFFT
ncbi:Glycoprotein-N-acetylgalactosamine 3-beta-galactosyltransferase 1 [Strongyloides ratti]|uniref:N-acetylgalactosaminide beta-1,3-galactosyltransferase n=1 Tax=Strongyloides ratti TaxID=34506 RepID=A0A090L2Q4_STRRB|nr:Glycoprotein-N-acetylgalactosamine 3-beta-galactosyltransferase 1 [Strongyloides ratti]CEF62387.1 Glycoprotein-N-acetylgalactosamine 3-beta-galactosyltransferase 1 [Strongyloides ratti]